MRTTTTPSVDTEIGGAGYAFVPGARMRALLEAAGPLDDWPAFAASWDGLDTDTYMADGGRYRRRRHAVYRVGAGGRLMREPHQPHHQGLDYNGLNGGIDRWFAPVADGIGGGACLATILAFCERCFGALSPATSTWRAEIHQFRIEARAGMAGKPTPEGMHRDGVDYVLVLLIDRSNIASGTTTVADLDQRPLGSFTLTVPFDAALVDDSRVYHGVTPVVPIDLESPAHRDVLVVTFKKSA